MGGGGIHYNEPYREALKFVRPQWQALRFAGSQLLDLYIR